MVPGLPVVSLLAVANKEQGMKYLNQDQVNKLLEVYEEPEKRLLIRFLYYTGCRVSEALALTPRHVDSERRVVSLPALKTKEKRDKLVVLDLETLRILELFIRARKVGKDKPIFDMDRWRAWKIVKDAGEAIGVKDLHPHTLRHTFAVHWASGGGDLLKLQRQLGHKRLSTTTDMYIHYATDDIQKDYDKIFKE